MKNRENSRLLVFLNTLEYLIFTFPFGLCSYISAALCCVAGRFPAVSQPVGCCDSANHLRFSGSKRQEVYSYSGWPVITLGGSGFPCTLRETALAVPTAARLDAVLLGSCRSLWKLRLVVDAMDVLNHRLKRKSTPG